MPVDTAVERQYGDSTVALEPPANVPAAEMRGIVKHFNQTVALRGADLTVRRGEVNAVVGENGAGKSTLMSILAGVTQADQGQIILNGTPVPIRSVEAASKLGIVMVYQHFTLFPSLTVAENLTLGREPRRRTLYDRAAAVSAVKDLSERYDLYVDPTARVSDLSVGDLQRLEILRALYRGAEILILDEPTGVLTPQEAQGLFRVIRELKLDGKTTVFISHKLEEVLEISDTITVLRDGQVTGVVAAGATTSQELARLMVGREVFLQFEKPDLPPSEPVLEISHLSGPGVQDISLQVCANEIVGIAGVTGNGQTELADLIAGLLPAISGSIRIGGQDVTSKTVGYRRAAGLANIPEDRYKRGLASSASISDNLLLGAEDVSPINFRGILNLREIAKRADSLIKKFQIKAQTATSQVATLSGGNAQRVVIARELAESKPFILASQPTRGIDIAASEFVRRTLLNLRNDHVGILLISADLNEILSMADRILVMYSGKIVGELVAKDATETQLGLLMMGIRDAKTN